MRKAMITSAILAAGLMLAGCGNTPSKTEAFENDIEALREAVGNVGMSVAVVKDNKIIYTHSFGVADMETGALETDETLYRIASISKSFTSTSMMQMIEKGKVSLDTDASELAGFPIRNPKYPDTVITLEMMLSHTSSINDSQGYFTFDQINPSKNPDYAKCYNDYEPGKGYEYCNLNFNLIGSFLERLSGERFDQYVVNHVLKPLGLYGGYCVDSLDVSRFSQLYAWNGKDWERQDEAYERRSERIANYIPCEQTAVFSPTGGMKMSAPDLAKYMMMHMNYGISPDGVRIIPENLSKDMQIPRSDDENYGLALWVEPTYIEGLPLVGHTGGAYGMRSAMFFRPAEKYGFVIISSGAKIEGDTRYDNILRGSINLMYEHFIK
ncbi:MAG: serine hydrolase [Bacteroidales bacterium]|nr:serine hydrolase [Bacteroidales bacterium]